MGVAHRAILNPPIISGDIRATVLHTLYEKHANHLKIGSVVVLKRVGVLSAGHRDHCLTVTANNLVAIYCPLAAPRTLTGGDEIEAKNGVRKIVVQDWDVGELLGKLDECLEEKNARKSESESCVSSAKRDSNCSDGVTGKVWGVGQKHCDSGVDTPKKRFNFKRYDCKDSVKGIVSESCDRVAVGSSQVSVKADKTEHVEIWKNLLEDIDTDALFDEF